MDILSDYRITAATAREFELAETAERVRVARARAHAEEAATEPTRGRTWFARVTDGFSTSTPSRSERAQATPCAPATR